MSNLIKAALNFLYRAIFGATEDNYLTVVPKAGLQKRSVVPVVEMKKEEFDLSQVPTLGPDHEKLVAKAKDLYPTSEHNQYKWLMGVHRLRTGVDGGWVMDPENTPAIGEKSHTKWGVPGTAGVPVPEKDKGFAHAPLSC